MDLTKIGRQWRGGFAIALGLLGTTVLGVNPVFAGYASVVVDAGTGEVLNEVNADQENYPASLTKMMTLYLAFEALKKGHLKWDEELPVSQWAAEKIPTKLGLVPGDTVSVHDCILGMIVLSANDAATVMAEALGGSEPAFAKMMTAKAHELGMTSTTFRNAAGLPDEDQVTTARDLVKLAMALYQDFPDRYKYFSTREFTFRGRLIEGHNHLMYRYAGMDGLKTGFTSASGFNLAASAVRDDHRLFAVVMGGRSGFARDNLMATLLDNAFAHRDTDPELVAEAAGRSSGESRHLLADLAPVREADAATIEAKPARFSRRERHGEIVAAVPAGHWAVQIGAFAKAGGAEQATRDALHIAALRGRRPEILDPSKGERLFRARLAGFSTEKQAREACSALKHAGHACAVMPPAKFGVRLAAVRS
jgi:D-alanyl-D-alanine carboxypeptidase/D-alanyl-D-alanine carboxypeptidase (penicillin-binding protein 5/6)